MNERSKKENALVISYLNLRKAIGFLGIAFPLVLYLGGLIFFETGLQTSVSYYYYTGMRDVFVGSLFVVGFFLLSYKGYTRADNIAGTLACIFAVGTTLFPTRSHDPLVSNATIGTIHDIFAGLLFLTLTYFALCLFTKTDPSRSPGKKKLLRNKIYKLCGYTMLVSILLIAVHQFLPDAVRESLKAYTPVFWLETSAVLAFGISWIVKGKAILNDET